MKHLLTAIACCLAVAGSGQTPYNPDSDGNNLMGSEDLMSLLSLYGSEFYPNNTPVFQYCYGAALHDTCFVDEATDVLFLDGLLQVWLPEDSSYKKINYLPYEQIETGTFWQVTHGPIGSTSQNAAGFLFRSPTNRWHVVE